MNVEKYNDEPIKVYQCGNCMEEFETIGEAKKCCMVFICGNCETEFDNRKEANDCCKELLICKCGIKMSMDEFENLGSCSNCETNSRMG